MASCPTAAIRSLFMTTIVPTDKFMSAISDGNTIAPIMTECINIIAYIAVIAGTSVGGIALFLACRRSHNGGVVMGVRHLIPAVIALAGVVVVKVVISPAIVAAVAAPVVLVGILLVDVPVVVFHRLSRTAGADLPMTVAVIVIAVVAVGVGCRDAAAAGQLIAAAEAVGIAGIAISEFSRSLIATDFRAADVVALVHIARGLAAEAGGGGLAVGDGIAVGVRRFVDGQREALGSRTAARCAHGDGDGICSRRGGCAGDNAAASIDGQTVRQSRGIPEYHAADCAGIAEARAVCLAHGGGRHGAGDRQVAFNRAHIAAKIAGQVGGIVVDMLVVIGAIIDFTTLANKTFPTLNMLAFTINPVNTFAAAAFGVAAVCVADAGMGAIPVEFPIAPVVIDSINVVAHIAVSAGAGVGGVALCAASGRSHNGGIVVGVYGAGVAAGIAGRVGIIVKLMCLRRSAALTAAKALLPVHAAVMRPFPRMCVSCRDRAAAADLITTTKAVGVTRVAIGEFPSINLIADFRAAHMIVLVYAALRRIAGTGGGSSAGGNGVAVRMSAAGFGVIALIAETSFLTGAIFFPSAEIMGFGCVIYMAAGTHGRMGAAIAIVLAKVVVMIIRVGLAIDAAASFAGCFPPAGGFAAVVDMSGFRRVNMQGHHGQHHAQGYHQGGNASLHVAFSLLDVLVLLNIISSNRVIHRIFRGIFSGYLVSVPELPAFSEKMLPSIGSCGWRNPGHLNTRSEVYLAVVPACVLLLPYPLHQVMQ